MIYFIQRGENGPVKIGRAIDVRQRLRTLQTSSPERLGVLLEIAGDSARECAIHAKLASSRIDACREWFHPTSELFDFIEQVREPEFEIRGAKAFAVLRRRDASDPTTFCPFCGERHLHGEGDGHRVPQCKIVIHPEIRTPSGITVRHADGYVVRSHGSTGAAAD